MMSHDHRLSLGRVYEECVGTHTVLLCSSSNLVDYYSIGDCGLHVMGKSMKIIMQILNATIYILCIVCLCAVLT